MGGERRSQERVRSGQRRRPVAWCAAWQQQRRCASSDEPAARDGSVELEWFEIAYRVYLAALVGGGHRPVAERPRERRAGDRRAARRRARPRPGRASGSFAVAASPSACAAAATAARSRSRRPTCATCCSLRCRAAHVLLHAGRAALRALALRRPDRAAASPVSWRPGGCPARRRRGPPAAAAAGALIGLLFVAAAVLVARRCACPAGRPRRSARRRARRPGLRGGRRLVRARATRSAAWRCGACARTAVDLVGRRGRRGDGRGRPGARRPPAPRAARRGAPTSCRSCTSPSRCRTCAPWCCCAASCAASSPAPGRGGGSTPRRRSAPARAVWRRGLRGLARYPASRLARMATLAVAAGVCAVGGRARGTTPALLGIGGRALPARARRRRAAVAGDRPPRSHRRRAPSSAAGCSRATSPRRRSRWCRSP